MIVKLTDAQRAMLADIRNMGYALVSAKNGNTARILESKGLVVIDSDWKARLANRKRCNWTNCQDTGSYEGWCRKHYETGSRVEELLDES